MLATFRAESAGYLRLKRCWNKFFVFLLNFHQTHELGGYCVTQERDHACTICCCLNCFAASRPFVDIPFLVCNILLHLPRRRSDISAHESNWDKKGLAYLSWHASSRRSLPPRAYWWFHQCVCIKVSYCCPSHHKVFVSLSPALEIFWPCFSGVYYPPVFLIWRGLSWFLAIGMLHWPLLFPQI